MDAGQMKNLRETFRDMKPGEMRSKDTNKWYALVARLTADKVGGNRKDIIEAVNLRRTDSMDGPRFLPAYHMNKKTWTTIVLDGTVGAEELQKLLKESRKLATKSQHDLPQ